jgi:bifunctional UDP-N-acetylglucosamine pyrophosphorylase/glucosamine-1-phosphate N-acetyltransferase
MNPEEVARLIRAGLPGAEVRVQSQDQTHFEARIVADQFAGLGRVARHQVIYRALGERVGREIHALTIEALTPAEAGGVELAVREVNTSIYCFRRSVLAPSLRRLSPANAQGEYYLTDVVGVLADAGHKVSSVVVEDTMEVAGVNDRAQLAVAEAELRDRINERWMRRGVTMWDPERTYIDADVRLATDVVLLPGVILQGACTVDEHAEIGPDTHLVDTSVGEGAAVANSVCRRSVIGSQARVGPFAVLPEGTEVPAGGVLGSGPAPAR